MTCEHFVLDSKYYQVMGSEDQLGVKNQSTLKQLFRAKRKISKGSKPSKNATSSLRLNICRLYQSGDYSNHAPQQYTEAQANYLIAINFTEFVTHFGEFHEQAYLSGLLIAHDITQEYTGFECFLLAAIVYALVAKVFHTRPVLLFQKLCEAAPIFSRNLLVATESLVLQFLSYNIPAVSYMDKQERTSRIRIEQTRILQGIGYLHPDNPVQH